MPSRKLHNLLTRLLLQDDFSSVSEYIDKPYAKYGRSHRKLRHDTAMILRVLEKEGVRPALAAWLHLVLDYDKHLKRDLEAVETIIHAQSRR